MKIEQKWNGHYNYLSINSTTALLFVFGWILSKFDAKFLYNGQYESIISLYALFFSWSVRPYLVQSLKIDNCQKNTK